jgi:ribosomal protein S18 acetylase RimI-like enzyme
MAELKAGSLAADEGEYLDPGYDLQTPDGDNLLLDFGRAERALWTSWGTAVGATVAGDAERGATWVDSGSPSVFGNPVVWTRPVDHAAAKDLIEQISADFAQREGGPYLLYSVFPTPDLRSLGMDPVGHPPCMLRMPQPSALGPPDGLTIARVTTPQQLDDFERVLVEAYPVSDLLPWNSGSFMNPALLTDGRWHLFVGYVEGRPVATAASFVSGQVVDVTLVTCRPEFRGRGIGRAVTQAAVDADTTRPALLIASDDGQPVYRSMGFWSLTRFTLWVGHRAASTH